MERLTNRSFSLTQSTRAAVLYRYSTTSQRQSQYHEFHLLQFDIDRIQGAIVVIFVKYRFASVVCWIVVVAVLDWFDHGDWHRPSSPLSFPTALLLLLVSNSRVVTAWAHDSPNAGVTTEAEDNDDEPPVVEVVI